MKTIEIELDHSLVIIRADQIAAVRLDMLSRGRWQLAVQGLNGELFKAVIANQKAVKEAYDKLKEALNTL